jgi:hypothetical protein
LGGSELILNTFVFGGRQRVDVGWVGLNGKKRIK